jgi:AcrR family transcriptional regulator
LESQVKPTSETRTPLSRERVLRAAIELADEGGIESLSIRKLAQEVGLRPMSLYHYVAGKDEIVNGILEMVVGQFELAGEGGDWESAIRRSATSAHHVLLAHPWACALMMSGAGVSASRMRYMEALLGRLRGAGFSAETTDHAYHALDSHIIGFTLWHVGYSAGMKGFPDSSAATSLRDLIGGYPYLVEHAEQHMRKRRPGEPTDFEFGLELILGSLARMLGTG